MVNGGLHVYYTSESGEEKYVLSRHTRTRATMENASCALIMSRFAESLHYYARRFSAAVLLSFFYEMYILDDGMAAGLFVRGVLFCPRSRNFEINGGFFGDRCCR